MDPIRIPRRYVEHLMPEITTPGDDHNYGSAAMLDVMILQVSEGRELMGAWSSYAMERARSCMHAAGRKARGALSWLA